MAETVDEVIAGEREKMRAFGEEASRYFSDLNTQIQNEFTGSLSRMLNEEVPKFTRSVEQAFQSLGLGEAGKSISGLVADSLGGSLGLGGNVLTDALDGALAAALGSAINSGKIDLNAVFRAGYFAGGRSINKGIKLSRLQATVGNALEMERSRRGL